MSNRVNHARAALLPALIASACNGQFDFDTALPDAGTPPISIEAGPSDDVSAPIDAATEAPGTGIHIACGQEDCPTAGCCSSTTNGLSCVDIAGGETCAGLLIQCDDTDDCPEGQVCCAEGEDLNRPPCTSDVCTGTPRLLRVHCEPEAHCRDDFAILCNPDRPSPCTQCVSSDLMGLPPGYHQCVTSP